MAATKLIARSIMALTLAIAPAAVGSLGLNSSAYAKGGNGGGNGGDHGGGHGSDHGGGHGSDRGGSSSHGNSGNSRSGKETKDNKSGEKSHQKSHTSNGKEKTSKPAKAEKVVTSAPVVDPVVEPEPLRAAPGLRSLNRNYHAYLNSSDPKMAGISAYAIAYAEFEAENGVDAIPTDPALSDEALREALAGFTKDGVVSDDMVDDAKEILGVGPAVGKIDEIRETLPPVDETDPDAEVAE
ncbi:hypothetical protein AB4Z34_14675 [Ensifer sp. 2YAB10]|uniref:hypothetical protein n=1 Tax=unclassified Ensifer TaxID=2633371 RepID=UPI003F9054D9